MSTENCPETQALQAINYAATVHVGHSHVPFVVVPEGYRLRDLEDLQERPSRIRQSIKAHDLDSFVSYVKRWSNPSSLLLANDEARTLDVVVDHHAVGGDASWGSHTVSYATKLSREAVAWQARDGKSLPQLEFAEFLEEHIADVVEPDGARLLEQALQLQIIRKSVVGSVARLQTGEFQLNWSEDNEKGTVELPEKITLGIPLFHNGEPYKIQARLRYRLNEGKVTFHYKLIEWQRAIEDAFDRVVVKASDGIGASILRATRTA